MIALSRKIAVGSAHSKLILTGEHAVVYEKPAIALPFPLIEVKSIVEESFGTIMIACDYYSGPLHKVPMKMKGLANCIQETLLSLNQPEEGLLIRLSSTIPLGRGLGSSAAVAIAIVKSLYAYFERTISQNMLITLADIAESYAHGNPSGIDVAQASTDYPLWFQRGKGVKRLRIGSPIHLVIADTGRMGDTLTAVSSVRERFHLAPTKTKNAINLIGKITHMAKNAIISGEIALLGRLLNLNQEKLDFLGVSDDGINRLIKTARRAGAIGAKLTGGGRGGCIIALAENLKSAEGIAEALLKAGAEKTWFYTIEKD